MKYFTPEWWEKGQDDWDPFKRFEAYVATVRAQLPEPLLDLWSEHTLHDAGVKRIESRFASRTVIMTLDGWDRELQNPIRYALSFGGVSEFDQVLPPGPYVEEELGDLGYWEFELIDPGVEVRMLFVSGAEFRLLFEELKRVQRRHQVPVVLTRDEVKATLAMMEGTCRLMAELIYGAGLRVHECVTLRIKDIDLGLRTISIRSRKGAKDRTTILPDALYAPLQQHLLRVATLHKEDLSRGSGLAPMPDALSRKTSICIKLIVLAVSVSVGSPTAVGRERTIRSLAHVGLHRSACIQAGIAASSDPQACQHSHSAPLVRDTSAGSWYGHQNDPTVAWAP